MSLNPLNGLIDANKAAFQTINPLGMLRSGVSDMVKNSWDSAKETSTDLVKQMAPRGTNADLDVDKLMAPIKNFGVAKEDRKSVAKLTGKERKAIDDARDALPADKRAAYDAALKKAVEAEANKAGINGKERGAIDAAREALPADQREAYDAALKKVVEADAQKVASPSLSSMDTETPAAEAERPSLNSDGPETQDFEPASSRTHDAPVSMGGWS